jgi:uncharacterized protein (TIGR00369 family)
MSVPTAPTDDVLARWLAREAELRPRFSSPGVARPEQVAGRTGLQVLQAMLDGELPPAPIARTLDFILLEVGPGRAVFQGQPRFDHYNPLGTVHGGWIATLLDSAVGCAIHSALPAGKTYTTLELKVNYVRAVTDRVPRVQAQAEVIHLGGRVGTAQARLVGPDGALFAHASTTCLVMDPR